MGHSEIGVGMNVYGHLFEGAQAKLTDALDALMEATRGVTNTDIAVQGQI